MSVPKWNTIESDPAIFNELLLRWEVGTPLLVDEVFSLDMLTPETRGLVFLFKYEASKGKTPPPAAASVGDVPIPPFFLSQRIHDACGSISLVHLCLNSPGMDAGPILNEYHAFAQHMPYDVRGELLEQSERIRESHNYFSRPEIFDIEDKRKGKKADAFHFITYVPHDSGAGLIVYELDGLKPGPIPLGRVGEGENWTEVAKREMERRMAEYAESEVHFNVLSVVDCPLAAAARSARDSISRLRALTCLALSFGIDAPPGADPDVLEGELEAVLKPARDLGVRVGEASTEEGGEVTDDTLGGGDELLVKIQDVVTTYRDQIDAITSETERRVSWSKENERRRHNFVPLIMGLLKGMADKGVLSDALTTAQAKAKEQRVKAMEREAGLR